MSKPEAPEFQIERDYDNRCAHARAMFNMAVRDAEAEMDLALSLADEIRQGELADHRHASREAVTPTLEDVAMVKRDLDEEKFRQQFGITRMTDIRP